MRKLLVVAVITFSYNAFAASTDIPPSRVKPNDSANSDLVIVRPDDGADQDAIIKDKQNQMDATEDDAQNRKPPDKTTNYTRIVPFYGGEAAPKISKKLKNGDTLYEEKKTEGKYSGGLSVGPYNPSQLQGDSPGITYQNIYGTSPAIMINFDAEYQFFRSAGKLSLKLDLGLMTAKGLGRFVHDYNPNIGQISDLQLTLIGVPLIPTLSYKLQFWDKQPIIPFADAGAGYFTIFETRGDKQTLAESIKYGGAPVAEFTGGLLFMMDGLDREVVWQLNQDYGISHVYLEADARQILQLGGIFNFTSTIFEGGFLFEF